MTFLITEDVNLLKGIFLVGEISKFLAIGWDFPPSPGFPINVYGRNEVLFWEVYLLVTVLY